MAKRVSLKGRGADLFFGDSAPAAPPNAPSAPEPGQQGQPDADAPPARPARAARTVRPTPAAAAASRQSAQVRPPAGIADYDDAGTTGRPDDRTTGRPFARNVVRHSFDIRHDQLVALTQLQTERFLASGRKPKLGEMVQEALDAYLRSQNKRTNDRSSG